MACVVVFCTTYALILPAITMEKYQCGQEEHIHSEKCYEKVAAESVVTLACTYESLGVHVHSQDCCNSENQLICGQADYLVHVHDASCMDENGTILCQIPEIGQHVHTADCYKAVEVETVPVHTHTDACYTLQRRLICQTAETEGHSHGDGCFAQGQLVCGLTEEEAHAHGEGCSETILVCDLTAEPHVHGDSCYRQLVCETDHEHTEECSGLVLDCDLTEQPHVHTDTCYQNNFVCDKAETQGHVHAAACYESLLICELAEEDAHTHSDACYEMVSALICGLEEGAAPAATEETQEPAEPELICTEPVAGMHVHSEDCFAVESVGDDVLTCTLPEDENHTHGALCYGTWQLICTQEEHTHDLACMSDPEADVETPQIWEATFANVPLTGEWSADVLAIARSQLGYAESTKNYEVMEDGVTISGYTRYGDWYGHPYGDWCAMFVSFCLNYADIPQSSMPYDSSCPVWILELQAPEYDLYRPAGEYTPVPGDVIFFDWDENTYADHVGLVTEVIPATESDPAKVKTIEGNANDRVMAQEYALDNSHIMGYGELPEKPPVYVCGLEEHTHSETCYNAEGNLICGKEGHTHAEACGPFTDQELARIDNVIAMIDELPTYEEMEQTLLAYEEAEDMDSYEEYFIWVGQTGLRAYNAYQELTEAQQAQVTNIDRLMDLSSVWSVATLIETSTTGAITAYARNTINCTNSEGKIRPIVVYGQLLSTLGESATDTETLWMALNINESHTGRLYVDYISGYAALSNFMNWAPQHEDKDGDGAKEGFVLLIPVDYANEKKIIGYVNVGDMVEVTVNKSNTDPGLAQYNLTNAARTGGGLWDIWFYSAEKEEKDNSGELTIVQGKDTSDLIELNLFDYNSAINTKYNENSKFLGFQQDYGTKTILKNGKFHNLSFNFGNNITEDLAAGHSNITDENATGVINRVTSITGSKLADVPMSGAVEKLLVGGYPVIADFGASTDRYFHKGYEAEGVVQMNTANISGLFLYNETTGEFTFDSRENHAQFNAATNEFVLYDQIFSPNFIMYPFGNFMPLNDIVHDTVRSDRSDRPYMLEIANSARWKANNGYGSEYATLANVLYKYIDKMDSPELYNTRTWTAGNMVEQYFGLAYPNDPNETPKNLNNLLPQIYTLDYDTPSNFYFGMNMRMDLLMPKGGMTGQDTNQDGTPDYPMVFEFAGDDDVWVFIDDVLFLELSGIHRHVGGEIDFVNGLVHYYAFDSYIDGKIKTTPYKTETFAQILQAAGRSTDVLNEKGTFKDYTSHSFDFFYTERGSGSSVCRINFNFPMLVQPTAEEETTNVSVVKEVTGISTHQEFPVVGDLPEFSFQIMKANANGSRTQDPFYGSGVPYKVYDASTNKWLRDATTEAYGIFKIRAGERAEITGIPKNSGKYYIREVLEPSFYNICEGIYADGVKITQIDDIFKGQYKGPVSSVKDFSSGGHTVFTFNNKVKASYLTITKWVNGEGNGVGFDMKVLLNNKPIPVGTPYLLYDTGPFMENGSKVQVGGTQYVVEEGIVTVPGGTTAWIDNIMPGTVYHVSEEANSREGYTVAYTRYMGDATPVTGGITGKIPVMTNTDAHVCVIVTNTRNSNTVLIPVTKTLSNGSLDPSTPHTYSFTLNLESAKDYSSGKEYDVTYTDTKEVQVTGNQASFNFLISYSAASFPRTATTVLTYSIKENKPNEQESTHDAAEYEAVVVVTTKNGSITTAPYIFSLTKDGQAVTSAAFTNTLLGDLTFEKQVVGGQAAKEKEFTFVLYLRDANDKVLKNHNVTYTIGDDSETVSTGETGTIHVSLKHGEMVRFEGIPLGAHWEFAELCPEYIVSWQQGDRIVDGDSITGTLEADEEKVTCTNTSVYTLPETGGAGTIPYTMAGLVLICFSMAYLMYRSKARGRGSYRST